MTNPVLDLRDCGLGNTLIMSAGYIQEHGPPLRILPPAPPHVFPLSPDAVTIEIGTEEEVDPTLGARYCSLHALTNPRVQDTMAALTAHLARPHVPKPAVGFSFRTARAFPPEPPFMNMEAIRKMAQMARQAADDPRVRTVVICANDYDHPVLNGLRRDVACMVSGDAVRQWCLLRECEVVVHGVGSPEDGSITSTFAPTAAAAATPPARLVGVSNDGRVWAGTEYHW